MLATALVAAAMVTSGQGGCDQAAVMKTVFPAARTVGFTTRSAVTRVGRREPKWPGWCGNWTAKYTGLRGRPSAFAEVRVSLYRTPRDGLLALEEPAFGPVQMLPNGLRTRTLVDGYAGAVVSLVRNVFISTGGCCGPPPDYKGAGAVREQLRIHRAIQARVLRL
jgi:hypothetical protein